MAATSRGAAGWTDRSRLRLRRAQPGDALSVAEVHVRSWQGAYRGLMPDTYLDDLDPAERAARYEFGPVTPGKPDTVVATVVPRDTVDDSDRDRDSDGDGDGDGGGGGNGERIVGFATTIAGGMEGAAGSGAFGLLAALYVDPPHWGRGVGRLLMEDARRRLADAGDRRAGLWVLVGNERAIRFYEIDGWAATGEIRTDEVWGIEVAEARYARTLF